MVEHIETISQIPLHHHDQEVIESVEIAIADSQVMVILDHHEGQLVFQDLLPEHRHGATPGDHIENLLLIEKLE